MPPTTMDTAWHAEALRLRDYGKDAVEVGEAVGKHPATVRKLFARNPPASTNGNGHIPNAEIVVNGKTVGYGAEGMANALGAMIPGQTTVDDHLAPDDETWDGAKAHSDGFSGDTPPEDDPEHPDSLAAFRGEAGEAPPSRAVDQQDGLFDVVWEDERLLAVLEEREDTRAVKLTASKAHKLKDDEAKALLGGYSLAVGEVARIGRFRIKKTETEGREVSFVTEAREQLRIAVDDT